MARTLPPAVLSQGLDNRCLRRSPRPRKATMDPACGGQQVESASSSCGGLARGAFASLGPLGGRRVGFLAVDEVLAADQREGAERADERDRSADDCEFVDAVREGGADRALELAAERGGSSSEDVADAALTDRDRD